MEGLLRTIENVCSRQECGATTVYRCPGGHCTTTVRAAPVCIDFHDTCGYCIDTFYNKYVPIFADALTAKAIASRTSICPICIGEIDRGLTFTGAHICSTCRPVFHARCRECVVKYWLLLQMTPRDVTRIIMKIEIQLPTVPCSSRQ
jgi:hypothetical protein